MPWSYENTVKVTPKESAGSQRFCKITMGSVEGDGEVTLR